MSPRATKPDDAPPLTLPQAQRAQDAPDGQASPDAPEGLEDGDEHRDEHRDEDERLLRAMRQRHLRGQAAVAAAIMLLLVLGVGALGAGSLKRAWRAASLQWAMRAAAPKAPADALTRHHTRHLSAWFIAQSRVDPQDEAAQREADAAHAALLENLREDAVGLQLHRQLRELVLDAQALPERAEAIMGVIAQWNAHMDRLGQRWWVDANILGGAERPVFYTKAYKVLADVQVQLGQQAHRTRIVARADRTNIRESLLGHTSPHHDGAIILADRIYDFSIQEVWPLLAQRPLKEPKEDQAQASGEPSPEQAWREHQRRVARAHRARVRAEVERGLPAAAFALLERYAQERVALVEVLDAVRARHGCGSTFVIATPGWEGVGAHEEEVVRAYARRDRFARCPSITPEEADALIRASQRLRDEPALKGAVEALAAFVSRGIAVHEARHAADHAQLGDFDQALPCEPCEGRLSARARAELSAYLASFADERFAHTALFQACGNDLQRATPHARALRALLPELGMKGCDEPAQGLVKRAQELEMVYFGRSHAIKLPDDYPESIELYEAPSP